MKFACPKCQTRYSVPDANVPADKTLRFTCKECANVFRIRRKKREMPVPLAEAAVPAGATRVANIDEIMGIKRRSRTDSQQPPAPPPPSPFVAVDEWFVLLAGKQHGPLSTAEVGRMVRDGAIDTRSYVWRDGMADWLRLGAVPEIAGVVNAGPAIATTAVAREGLPTDREPTVETPALDKLRLQAALGQLDEPAPGAAAAVEEAVALVALLGEPTGQSVSRSDGFAGSGPFEAPRSGGGSPVLLKPPSVPVAVPPRTNFGPTQGIAYQEAPPGQETRLFMATAGLFKRRRKQRIAAVAAGVVVVLLATLITLDVAGVYTIPAMGVMYDLTGIEDPNAARAMERVEEQLASVELTPERRAEIEKRRAALRDKLMGRAEAGAAGTKRARAKGARPGGDVAAEGEGAGDAAAGQVDSGEYQVGIAEAAPVDKSEHDLTAAIMTDKRKSSQAPKLDPLHELQAPNLPDGLTQEAIFDVINKNQRAMSLCISQSMKAGENLSGRMEVEMSIAASGTVSTASIGTPRFAHSTIGSCTVKTVKRWKFPAFNGKPVTVIFPYVLSATF